MQFLPQILLVAFFILCNGFFVATETALVRVRRSRIEELIKAGRKGAKDLDKAITNIGTYLSATQLGITVVSLIIGWVGEPIVAQIFFTLFSHLPKTFALFASHAMAFAIGFIFITFFHIIFGELVPKNLALQKTENVALFNINFMKAFVAIFHPVIWLLNKTAQLVMRLFHFKPLSANKLAHSEEEIKIILSYSAASGVISQKEAEFVKRVFALSDTQIKNIATTRTDIVAFNILDNVSDVIKKIQNNKHSRILIYEYSVNDIIGFIHIKDFYTYALTHDNSVRLVDTDLVRKTLTIKDTTIVSDAITLMQKEKTHLATLSDAHGHTSGVVTIESLTRAILGYSEDEVTKPIDTLKVSYKNWD